MPMELRIIQQQFVILYLNTLIQKKRFYTTFGHSLIVRMFPLYGALLTCYSFSRRGVTIVHTESTYELYINI